MAAIQTDPKFPTRRKATCDVPRCVEARRARGQPNGRWLMTVEFGEDRTVTVTVVCKECGGTHSVTMEIPQGARRQKPEARSQKAEEAE